MKFLPIIAYILLLVGGLAHFLPDVLAPILSIGTGIFTVQRLIGLLSVVVGVILLVKKE
jgi:hypothetical protein